LLDQTGRHGHRSEPVPQHRRVAPGKNAGAEHLQWFRGHGLQVLFLAATRCAYPCCYKPCSERTNSKDKWMSFIPKKGTVYVVDDDEAVRDSLQWLLEGKDYRVRCF